MNLVGECVAGLHFVVAVDFGLAQQVPSATVRSIRLEGSRLRVVVGDAKALDFASLRRKCPISQSQGARLMLIERRAQVRILPFFGSYIRCATAVLPGLLAISLIPQIASGQGRFDQIRSEVHAPSLPNDSRRENQRRNRETCSHGNYRSSCSLCEDDEDQSFAGAVFSGLLSSLLSSGSSGDDEPHQSANAITYTFDDEETYQQKTYFAHYPYADGYDGYLMNESYVPARPQTGAMRVRFYYATDFDDIEIWTGSILAESSSGWGIDSDISYLTEDLPGGGDDELILGDVNILYRVMTSERAILRGGLGTNFLHDSASTDFGFNGTLLLDVFPERPFTWTSQFDIGKIRSATTVHLETTLGWSWEHVEVFGGFDYRRIGSVDLAGPMFGIRGWW